MTDTYDVVIIGGGVIGSAAAFFLAERPDFSGTVAVVERDSSYEFASTPRSCGGVRQQFTTPQNIRISQFTAAFLAQIADRLAVDGDVPDVNFRKNGYLFLGTEAMAGPMRRINEVQKASGAPVELLDGDALAARFAWLNTEGIACGSFGEEDEGWIDPFSLLQAFRRKAKSLGVDYVDDEVVSIARDGGRVTGVTLASGRVLGCGAAVNAAGYRGGKVAAMIGADLPVRPRKRSVFVVDIREQIADYPLVIDHTNVYWRPEGQFFICGRSPDADNDPEVEDDDFVVDHAWFESEIWPIMAERDSRFEALKVVNSWAGQYDMNLFDHNAVIGPHPDVENFYFANGFSGHGLQQSPAVGRAISELITTGTYETLDLSVFRFERIAENKPFLELAVV